MQHLRNSLAQTARMPPPPLSARSVPCSCVTYQHLYPAVLLKLEVAAAFRHWHLPLHLLELRHMKEPQPLAHCAPRWHGSIPPQAAPSSHTLAYPAPLPPPSNPAPNPRACLLPLFAGSAMAHAATARPSPRRPPHAHHTLSPSPVRVSHEIEITSMPPFPCRHSPPPAAAKGEDALAFFQSNSRFISAAATQRWVLEYDMQTAV
jgi:hypothetical protein